MFPGYNHNKQILIFLRFHSSINAMKRQHKHQKTSFLRAGGLAAIVGGVCTGVCKSGEVYADVCKPQGVYANSEHFKISLDAGTAGFLSPAVYNV